jgi:NAD(P)-dependent dehydrogenase (short-subunit alcohol dehydrogenase family)
MGRAIALGFAREGADVAVNYVRNQKAALDTVAQITELGRRAVVVQADTSRKPEVDRMVAEVLFTFGRIDILVNNAGVLSFSPFLELTEADWDMVMGINGKGYFLVGQAVAREMVRQGKGKIINIISEAHQRAFPNIAHYIAAKSAAYMLSRAMALELASHKINVNMISPGPTWTDMHGERYKDPAELAKRLVRIPWGRIGKAEDVVAPAIYLASDAAENVTGACIAVDGGTTL